MSDFSREARAYCKQHRVYFYPNDAGCEQCERDMENIDEDLLENCVCDIEEGERLNLPCDKYTKHDNPYHIITIPHCAVCGHLEDCHDIGR